MAINLDHVTEQITVTDTATNASLTVQPKGTGAFNIAAGSSGVNLSNGGTVTAITLTSGGSGYTSVPSVTISAPTTAGGVQATAQAVVYVWSNPITSAGTGYTVGNTLTAVGGTGTPYSVTVSTINGSGGVTGVSIVGYGAYTVTPTNPVTFTGGSGSGFTSNMSWIVGTPVNITNAGSGYVEQPTVTFSGGGTGLATAYAGIGGIATIKALAANVASLQFATPGGVAFSVADTNRPTVDFWEVIGSTGAVGLRVAGATGNNNGIITSKGSGYLSLQTNGFGSESLRAGHTASAVNFIQANGQPAGFGPLLSSQGSDTNINMVYMSKGTGGHAFGTGGGSYTQQVFVSHTASAVNYVQVTGAVTSGNPVISAQGSDTNIGLSFAAKNNGNSIFTGNNGTHFRVRTDLANATNFWEVFGSTGAPILRSTATTGSIQTSGSSLLLQTDTSGTQQVAITHTASAVNYLQLTGATTGGAPTIATQGSDTNAPLSIASKGTGILYLSGGQLRLGAAGSNSLFVAGVSGNVNYVQIGSAGTGYAPAYIARGGDANVGLTFGTFNDANIDFYASGDPNAGTGKLQVRIAPIASAVNYLQLNGSVTGQLALIQTAGSDASVGLELRLKGTPVGPGFRIANNNGANVCFSVQTSVSAPANYHQMQPANAGSSPNIATAGSDTNIDLALTPKGTGNVRFGTYTGTALSIAGYIEIKDSGGTVRKLAVVA